LEAAPLWRCSLNRATFDSVSGQWCAMITPRTRPLKVKLILSALKEATDPQWRPIKYSLFSPLGLATLAAYLPSEDHAMIVDEHVEPLTLDDTHELVVIQVCITNVYRAYRIADHYCGQGACVCLGGLHVTSLRNEAAEHADAIFLGPGEQTFLNSWRTFVQAGRTLERIPPIRRDLMIENIAPPGVGRQIRRCIRKRIQRWNSVDLSYG
jgi:hypothetical protein